MQPSTSGRLPCQNEDALKGRTLYEEVELAAYSSHRFPMTYAERLQKRIEKTGSRLCVGLDPRPGDGGAAFARNFLEQVIDETAIWAAAFKPNMAYFEAMGIEGIRLLEDLLAKMPEDVPVILDAKRSDIGETQKYYAQGYFGGWNVDAVTLNPFLGYDSVEPFLDWPGKGIPARQTSNAKNSPMAARFLS
jgi:orotidine-5'-phosphate decarboxylase